MKKVILGLGSNKNPKGEFLLKAIRNIKNFFPIITCSSVYKTVSLLKDHQPDYFNMVISIYTIQSPERLLTTIKYIEKKLGRNITDKWLDREIDIDILDYDGIFYKSDLLHIPHPELHKRSFVLYPLKEVEESYIHPVTKKTIYEMINELHDDLNIKKMGVLTWP
ncbi:MAG: 2-amino-4-hydroxy-6-hydroxymethyldihydropteridine diphosphokinase [Calditerrivibrio sp.]|nr:2-amino-4-hydroxy-6-hydroxymethyldihydropteridine diphosphokinase [Calditerrivibrio sp.]